MNGNQLSVGSQSKVEDLSGLGLSPGGNPYAAFIDACQDNHSEIQCRYEAHRTTRNAQQKGRFLSADYQKLELDQHLFRIVHPSVKPGFRDERNCFVIWARPPDHILRLALQVQAVLQEAAKNLWLMPAHCMHLTVLEVAMCKNPEEILSVVSAIRPQLPSITSHTFLNRSRLVKPQLSFDLSAFALSFVPASGELKTSPPAVDNDDPEGVTQSDGYTYHHLRRDIFDKVQNSGLRVGSRYQVPSAHITLGRYISNEDHDSPEKRKAWLEALENINKWLAEKIWDKDSAYYNGEWVVGQETGLDARSGVLWYGGGRTIQMGEGF